MSTPSTTELPLFAHMNREPIRYDGESYNASNDEARLTGQLLRVFDCMKDGRWRSLAELKNIVGGSEAGLSARLRDLRKQRFGAHEVNKRHRGEASRGLYEYRLLVSGESR